jgi:hypothetical protein
VSGQLVGEVLDASGALRDRGLSQRGFHALIAIAEKASGADRTASVRWDHIRAGLYGASRRTAERAVHELIEAGFIRIAKPGFKNQHGRSRAPVSTKLHSAKSESNSAKSVGGFRHPDVVLDVSFDGSIDAAAHVPGECNLCDGDGYRQNGIPCDGVDRSETAARGSALVRAALARNGAK